ncbi:hypothetical protein [Pseudomonas sp. dw_358]|uniref:hypothetical protein n=1 Tax=Pseudomonas sp. dw_358 TaxID=2720083 RepID=UPI001BD5CF1B|nr:hypothetical protein [Pseudomonas sp. dw_358]
MDRWYSKSLDRGALGYGQLRVLNELRHQLCPQATTPYLLTIDALDAQTVVFFEAAHESLALAFGARPCERPVIDGRRLIDLQYTPLPVCETSNELLSAISENADRGRGVHAMR